MRTCKNCGRYFVLTVHGSTEYCRRVFDSRGRTCKAVGAMRQYLQSHAQDELLKIYRASADKAIFYRYFSEILGVPVDGKEEEALLQEALAALKKLYQEFGAAFTYGEQAKDPQNHEKLVETIDAFGPMPCRMISLTTERMARMIEDAIAGNLD